MHTNWGVESCNILLCGAGQHKAHVYQFEFSSAGLGCSKLDMY